ncbi:saccharopine dehydrogenase C-terminal domain-containing protein [Bacillus sp. 31A1R]|uniref:Saccharopine dehydrogenase C-terminal domain-containing protein n=1 Tax=Robertmurraya mangrovi TaxID=3098077 RepID=A0ABU5J3Y8_9BACI|nr:saccharopine dehydrogenase C-terminal domain-containing protein [Bacillus sp. 31A1R]MDZ5474077.1 saccharopine dehydrogenase C-terminal domain-containing protein [Bacillus sp. 31A1R]
MRVAVLGTGMIGNMIVCELAKADSILEIIAVDTSQSNLDRCLKDANQSKVLGRIATLDDWDTLVSIMKEVDIAVACLPHFLSLPAVKAAIEGGCHLIDLVGSKYLEKAELHNEAKEKGVLIVPGAGVAPGITNFLAARGIELLDEAEEAVMICGGIPRHPLPPLWYQVVFRLESVMGLYTRPALAAENGHLVELPPLSGKETLHFPNPVGECEAVITDAHSVAFTLKNKVKRLYEKTVRYKGHWDKMAVLAELGFLDEDEVIIEGMKVCPRKLSMAILEPKMKGESNEDITVLRVTVKGKKDGKSVKLEWEMVDLYDNEKNITSMARTTGYPAVILTEWLANGTLKQSGVVSIEELIIGDYFDPFMEELKQRNIHIKFEKSYSYENVSI